MGIISDNISELPKYRFIIESKYGQTICDKYPVNWKEATYRINRRIDAAGVFPSYNIESLVLLGSGAKIITTLFNESQINAKATYIIQRLNRQTMDYDNYPAEFAFKFGSYKTVKVGSFGIGVSIGVNDTSVLSKWDERKDVKIDLSKLESIGGMSLDEYEDAELLSKIKIAELNGSLNANLARQGGYVDSIQYTAFKLREGYNSIPFSQVNSDFTEDQRVDFESAQSSITDLDPIFDVSEKARDLTVSFDININVNDGFGIFNQDALDIRYAVFNGSTQVSDQSWNSPDANPFGRYEAFRNKTGSFTISVGIGESLYFYILQTASSGEAHFARPELSDPSQAFATQVTISETVVFAEETIFDGMSLIAATSRMAQHVLDNQYAFYSDYLGLTDFKYTASDYYATENNERFAHICSGNNIRGNTMFAAGGSINITPETLVSSISGIFNTGYGIEKIDDVYRLRIEEWGYFFNDTVILDLSDRISKYDITKEYMPELAYVEILTGYQNFVYESNNGRGEYNTESTFTTQLEASGTLDLKSDLVASTISISKCLEKPTDENGSEDTKEDDQIYIIKSQRDDQTTHQWVAETDELVTIEDDSSYFGASSLNTFITPVRNMIRNAERYMPSVYFDPSGKLRFQTSSKLSSLITKTVSDNSIVYENKDIPNSDLGIPRLLPIRLTIDECPFTYEDIELILATGVDGVQNRYKLIKLAEDEFIWILNIEMNQSEDKAVVTGIMRNNDY